MIDLLFPVDNIPSPVVTIANGDEASTSSAPAPNNNEDLPGSSKELAEIEFMESLYMKSTISALKVLKEIRSGSSTVSAFSLPPLQQTSGMDNNTWNKIPVLEQVAK